MVWNATSVQSHVPSVYGSGSWKQDHMLLTMNLFRKKWQECVSTLLLWCKSFLIGGNDTFSIERKCLNFRRAFLWKSFNYYFQGSYCRLSFSSYRPLINKKKRNDFSPVGINFSQKKPIKTEMKHVFLTRSFPIALNFIMQTKRSFDCATGRWWHVWWLWSPHDATWFRAGR